MAQTTSPAGSPSSGCPSPIAFTTTDRPGTKNDTGKDDLNTERSSPTGCSVPSCDGACSSPTRQDEDAVWRAWSVPRWVAVERVRFRITAALRDGFDDGAWRAPWLTSRRVGRGRGPGAGCPGSTVPAHSAWRPQEEVCSRPRWFEGAMLLSSKSFAQSRREHGPNTAGECDRRLLPHFPRHRERSEAIQNRREPRTGGRASRAGVVRPPSAEPLRRRSPRGEGPPSASVIRSGATSIGKDGRCER